MDAPPSPRVPINKRSPTMNPSIDLLDDIGSQNNSFAMSNASMDSVDLLSSPGAHSTTSNLDQIQEMNEIEPMAVIPSKSGEAAQSQEQMHHNTQSTPNKAIIYQIEFDVDHVGKNKPASKRMASWKYGIPRTSASTNCTIIEEHQAQLTWSTHSGRWSVSVDGSDVYANQTKGSVLDYKWKWNHRAGCAVDDESDGEEPIISMRIVACRKPPVRTSKEFRCYEFVIGGKPFRDLPYASGGNGFEEDRREGGFENDYYEDGRLMTILDIVEPGWRSKGLA